MDFKQLRSFVAVVECHSFTRAAEKLFTSQPTVSAHIRQLEEELHERLFLRTTKTMGITPRGHELYDYAVHVLRMQEELTERWTQSEKMILLGASTIPSAYLLPQLLPAFRAAVPNSVFSIHQGDSHSIVTGLADGRFELGFVGMDDRADGVTLLPLLQDTMVLITPNNARFREMLKADIAAETLLRTEQVLLREDGSGSQKSTDALLASICLNREELHVTAQLNDQESVKNLVAGGLGIATVSLCAAREEIEAGKLLSFPLPAGANQRTFYLAWRKGDYCKPQVKRFIDFALRYYGAEKQR